MLPNRFACSPSNRLLTIQSAAGMKTAKIPSLAIRRAAAIPATVIAILFLAPCQILAEQRSVSSVNQVSANLPANEADSKFAVTQQIFHADAAKPVAWHRLVFDSGVIYDLPKIQTRIVTVYDLAQNQVTLLDRAGKNQTKITTDKLVEFTASVKAEAAASKQHQASLGIGAVVAASDRVEGYTVHFGSGNDQDRFLVRYDVTTQPATSPAMAVDFGRFSDCSSRLSLLRHRGLPPFARMAINHKLTETGTLPRETFLTIDRAGAVQKFRSTTKIQTLSEEDAADIATVRGMMTMYPVVDIQDFTDQ